MQWIPVTLKFPWIFPKNSQEIKCKIKCLFNKYENESKFHKISNHIKHRIFRTQWPGFTDRT